MAKSVFSAPISTTKTPLSPMSRKGSGRMARFARIAATPTRPALAA